MWEKTYNPKFQDNACDELIHAVHITGTTLTPPLWIRSTHALVAVKHQGLRGILPGASTIILVPVETGTHKRKVIRFQAVQKYPQLLRGNCKLASKTYGADRQIVLHRQMIYVILG